MHLADKYFELEPEDIEKLPLSTFSQQELHELAYFIWAYWPDDPKFLSWRSTQLLPLLEEMETLSDDVE